ncbi:hypothetical protein BG004_007860 [Podila humilis]|nr:hypothetical protein BG004_007860 [Podila humilis]
MKLIYLHSTALALLVLTVPTTAQTQGPPAAAPTVPVDPTGKGPGAFGEARAASTQAKMYLGEAKFEFLNETSVLRTIFWSLDFTQPWRTDAPTWSKLQYQPGISNDTLRPLAVKRDGSAVYCFETKNAQQYDVGNVKWEKPFNLSIPFNQLGEPIADTDNDRFLHLNKGTPPSPPTDGGGGGDDAGDTLQLVQFNPADNSGSVVTVDMGPIANSTQGPGGATGAFPKGVYSSDRKSIYFANMENLGVKLQEYNLAAQKWNPVAEKGDIPPQRSGQCYVSAAGGKKIIMAGGLRQSGLVDTPSPTGSVTGYTTFTPTATTSGSPVATPPPGSPYNDVLNDVYSFDVATATWSKLANTPVGFYGSVCAVSGDYVIFYGGYNEYSEMPRRLVYNENKPYIMSLKDNAWVDEFTPANIGGPGSPPPSGADSVTTLSPLAQTGSIMTAIAVAAAFLL